MLEAWQGYIAMEIELGHLNEARSIYRRCYSKRFNGTGSELKIHDVLNKRQRNTAQNPNEVHGKEKGRARNLAEENEVEAKPKFEEHPKDQHIKDSTTGRAKGYTDKCTAFLSNLNFRATSKDLKKFFSDVGGVESVRILQDKFTGKSRGLTYVDFADDAHVATAVGKNKEMFVGKKISIARSNPKQKRKDSSSHGASGEHGQSSNQTFGESRAPHSAANKRSDNIGLKGRNTFAMPRNVRPLGVLSTNSKAGEVEDGKPKSNNEFREMILKK